MLIVPHYVLQVLRETHKIEMSWRVMLVTLKLAFGIANEEKNRKDLNEKRFIPQTIPPHHLLVQWIRFIIKNIHINNIIIRNIIRAAIFAACVYVVVKKTHKHFWFSTNIRSQLPLKVVCVASFVWNVKWWWKIVKEFFYNLAITPPVSDVVMKCSVVFMGYQNFVSDGLKVAERWIKQPFVRRNQQKLLLSIKSSVLMDLWKILTKV